MAFRRLVGLGLATVLLGSGCHRLQGEAGQTSSVPAPMIDDGPPPEILAIMTCATGPVRVLKDGRQTRGLKEALVVRRDGRVELRDRELTGMVIGSGEISLERIAKLDATLAQPQWAALPHTRGAPFPDGPSCEIVASHRRVERYDLPDDEDIVRRVRAELKDCWQQVDPWTAGRAATAGSASPGVSSQAAPPAAPTKIDWAPKLSKPELEWSAADGYCRGLGSGWRLPTRAEIETLLVTPSEPESAYRPGLPLKLPSQGYLWTGEWVSEERQGQPWIMNLSNGHVFNGSGRRGYAWCVRSAASLQPG
jgi:hypothetical protein